MKRDYNEKCLEALELVYTKYGIDMNNAPAQKMIDAITSELGCSIGYHIMSIKDVADALKNRKYYEFSDNKNEQSAKAYWDKIKGRNK